MFRFLHPPDEDDGMQIVEEKSKLRQTVLLNDNIHSFLRTRKNCIGEYYRNKKWDRFKKFANDYELIFTSSTNFPSMSSYQAISRSFFKLWEILHDFEKDLHYKTRPSIRAAFLAEGPGGFMEAFARYRTNERLKSDTIYGITLISADKNIPNWKLPKDVMESANIHLLTGADKTGSLYSIENIEAFASEIGESSLDLITSDGGFDFSTDFNNQEDLSMHLIICEMYMALRLQAVGGVFVLKIYDIQTMNTMRLLWVLQSHYQDLYIVKPLSSRPANSEKYVIAFGFKCAQDFEMMGVLLKIIQSKDYKHLAKIIVPDMFIHQITQYNVYYISRQVLNIHKTLTLIQTLKPFPNIPMYNQQSTLGRDRDITPFEHLPNTSFKECLKRQLKKSIRWCHKYGLCISIDAVKSYNVIYGLNDAS
jgi:23S rRNA U2552 (ribose-2'-O)-methylase RlmE/FtsJ